MSFVDWIRPLKMRGRVVWDFGDNQQSDLLVDHPKYAHLSLASADPNEVAKIALIGYDPDFHKKVTRGDFIIAGRNFGCGHAHLEAHLSLKAVGIGAVIAESIARNWFRTAISMGLPVLICENVKSEVNKGDELDVNLKTGEIKNITLGKILVADPLPDVALKILEVGGLNRYLEKKAKKQS